jgi:flavin-dependent dehydrogenase
MPGGDVHGPLLEPGAPHVRGVQVQRVSGVSPLLARVVIAADGRRSRLAQACNLARFARAPKRWAYGAYFTEVAGLGPRGEMHVRPDGYLGVAPLPGGLANVCVVREQAGAGRRARGAADVTRAEDVIATAIAADDALRARFAGARQAGPATVLGPLAVEAAAAGCPGLLLAGDAAGFVDPMTGDGLRFALRGGELAAEAALDELASGTAAFERLHRARMREFAGKWRVNRALRALVASPRGVQIAALVAGHWSAPVRGLIGIAGDVQLARSAGR